MVQINWVGETIDIKIEIDPRREASTVFNSAERED